MTAYLIHDSSGQAVSTGTVVADPLPDGLTAVALSDAEWDAIQGGAATWDAASLSLVAVITPPDLADLIRADLLAQATAATTVAKLRAVLIAALDNGTI